VPRTAYYRLDCLACLRIGAARSWDPRVAGRLAELEAAGAAARL
jgi:hypothetical protein